jgi:hypothetical protein
MKLSSPRGALHSDVVARLKRAICGRSAARRYGTTDWRRSRSQLQILGRNLTGSTSGFALNIGRHTDIERSRCGATIRLHFSESMRCRSSLGHLALNIPGGRSRPNAHSENGQ